MLAVIDAEALGHSTICVQRNSAMARPLSRCVAVASHTWVVRPRWAARALQSTWPSRAVPRKLLFNSMVVKPLAPSGRWATQP